MKTGLPDRRTPVVMVAGLDAPAVTRVADALLTPGTARIHQDLSHVTSGRVIRRVTWIDQGGHRRDRVTHVDLEHGCVSCTLREDLLPTLRRLHHQSQVNRIVLQLDPILEPERIAWTIDHVTVTGMPGFLDGPAGSDVRIDATIACIAEDAWLEAATGDETLAETGFDAVDDDRTLAQVAVGQVAFADAVIIAGCDVAMRDAWRSARLSAVLRRLCPHAPMLMELPQRPITAFLADRLLAAIGPLARRGRVDEPHDPLLRGQPSLTEDCGVRWVEFQADRPFHPERLHDAIDVLLDGVVCARGRLWLATQPEESLWLESAGGGLRVAPGGRWLVAMTDDELDEIDAERRALAALRWTEHAGDRHSSLVVLVHRADADEITRALRSACLTDAELAAGQDFWHTLGDPFGTFHADPCADLEIEDLDRAARTFTDHREDNR